MITRKIVKINEDKCNGCGLCVPSCHEGAIQIIDGKAKLIEDKLCDGLGNCLGECPLDAIEIIEREADPFDEEAVKEHLAKQNTSSHATIPHIGGGCPGSRAMNFAKASESTNNNTRIASELRTWPVQLSLVPVNASYFDKADLLVCADCVPFAYPNFHQDLLKNKPVVIGCPKLDNNQYYIEKLTQIIKNNDLKSIVVARMEVPCCGGLQMAVQQAVQLAGKDIPVEIKVIGIQGNMH